MKKNQQASGLIFSVILLFVILGMVVTLSSVTMLETKMNQKTKSSVGAFFNADAGIEWALNKIAVTDAATITAAFGNPANGVKPTGIDTDYTVYLLDKDGLVITDGSLPPSDIKAVRAVGTQGEETQRAIEAAVAGTGDFGKYTMDCVFGEGITRCFRMQTDTGVVDQIKLYPGSGLTWTDELGSTINAPW